MKAAEALALWLEHLANERRASPRTLEAYGFAAQRYIVFLEQHRGETLSVSDLGFRNVPFSEAQVAHAPRTVCLFR